MWRGQLTECRRVVRQLSSAVASAAGVGVLTLAGVCDLLPERVASRRRKQQLDSLAVSPASAAIADFLQVYGKDVRGRHSLLHCSSSSRCWHHRRAARPWLRCVACFYRGGEGGRAGRGGRHFAPLCLWRIEGYRMEQIMIAISCGEQSIIITVLRGVASHIPAENGEEEGGKECVCVCVCVT